MLKQRAGSIINMSSVVGVFGNAGQANYAASKAGIIGFSKSIAKEVGSRGIRCNAVAPGFIETDMTHALTEEQQKGYIENIPLKRLGTGQDIADTCIFLGSVSLGDTDIKQLTVILLIGIVLATIAGTWATKQLEDEWGHDPGRIVISDFSTFSSLSVSRR